MADMEAVNAFNAELSSLYEVKPPISKGKMTSITKAALKAVKLYKHVVQSVEKFIQKCKPEYKIPGLYVIDSIIRQSRHQFGAEKDVFAVRFARNLTITFSHLYKCPDEDKAKIIRVLNLWQKNKIFTPEAIGPLFDLANPNHAIWETIGQSQAQDASQSNANNSNKSAAALDFGQVRFKRELLEYDYDDEEPAQTNENRDQNVSHTSGSGGLPNSSQQSIADKIAPNVLNSFDALGTLLNNPEVLRQLQTLQEQMAAAAQQQVNQYATPEQERQRKLAELNKQEAAFEQRLAQTVARLPFAVECDFDQSGKPVEHHLDDKHDLHLQSHQHNLQQQTHNMSQLFPQIFQQLDSVQNLAQQQSQGFDQQIKFGNMFGQPPPQLPQSQQDMLNQGIFSHFNNYNQQNQQPFYGDKYEEEQDRSRRRRSRSGDQRRSRSRSRQRRRSRSGSRGRSSASRKKSYRSRSRERREEREKEKERQRKGFPPMKKEHLSICSTTLWVGHLSKLVSQEEISDTFGMYGDIVSIDVIPPRGCAFVVMNRRQDALRALDRLKNSKLQGKTITLAWAPGKGVKGREWKDYWEVDNGVSYIPWSKLKMDTDLDEFEDGGCIDEDTLPVFLKNRPKASTDSAAEPQGETELKGEDDSEPQGVPPPNPASGIPMVQGTPTQNDVRAVSGGQKPIEQDVAVISNANTPQAANTIPLPVPVPNPTGMVQPFVGMPPQMGMLGMPNYGMMVPPPLMQATGPFVAPPGGMMGMIGSTPGLLNPGPGGPLQTGPSGVGLLSDMSMIQSMVQQQGGAASDAAGVNAVQLGLQGFHSSDHEGHKRDRHNEDETSTRGNSGDQQGQRRKKSRFDDPSPPLDERPLNPDTQARIAKDDRVPLHERLKSIAEYGQMEASRPSLLGNPQGPPPPIMGNNVFNNGLPQMPLGDRPRPGFIPPLFNPVGSSPNPTMGVPNRLPGNPNWFEMNNDTGNPFVNPTNNPFVGNPFVQQSSSSNPFDVNASFEPLNNFNNDSPRGSGGGRGGWMPNRDGPQGSPQKWGGRGGGPGSMNSWGRNENRRDSGRYDDNWRDNPREQRGGHRETRDSRSGDRDRDRGRERDNDRSGRGDRRGSRDRSGGRDWKSENRRGGRNSDGGRDRGGRRRRSSERNERRRDRNSAEKTAGNDFEQSQVNGEEVCWEYPRTQNFGTEEHSQQDASNQEELPQSAPTESTLPAELPQAEIDQLGENTCAPESDSHHTERVDDANQDHDDTPANGPQDDWNNSAEQESDLHSTDEPFHDSENRDDQSYEERSRDYVENCGSEERSSSGFDAPKDTQFEGVNCWNENVDEKSNSSFQNPCSNSRPAESDDWSRDSGPQALNGNGNTNSQMEHEHFEAESDSNIFSSCNRETNERSSNSVSEYNHEYNNDCGENSNSGDYNVSEAKSQRFSVAEDTSNHKTEDSVNHESSYDNSFSSAKVVQPDVDNCEEPQSENNVSEPITEEGTV